MSLLHRKTGIVLHERYNQSLVTKAESHMRLVVEIVQELFKRAETDFPENAGHQPNVCLSNLVNAREIMLPDQIV